MRARAAPAPIVPPRRLQRWLKFVWLWLLAYAAFLCFDDSAARWRLAARRTLRDLIIVRAAAFMRPHTRAPHRHAPPPGFARIVRPNILRAAFGGALRQRLNARGAGEAVAALFAALQDFEKLARAIARRLPRGLTRLRPIVLTHALSDAFASTPPARPPAADTS